MLPTPEPYGPISKLIISGLLLAFCAALHAAGIVGLGRWLKRRPEAGRHSYVNDLWSVVRIVWMLIGLHVVTILLWAVTYWKLGCLSDMSTSFYFSAITYTTVGYGDVVLAPEWRSLCGTEALCGIFMMGLSTAFFFAALSRTLQHRLHT